MKEVEIDCLTSPHLARNEGQEGLVGVDVLIWEFMRGNVSKSRHKEC